MQAVILTGMVAGFVHVVSGADHLIAMAPAAINNPQKALKNSFSWGSVSYTHLTLPTKA